MLNKPASFRLYVYNAPVNMNVVLDKMDESGVDYVILKKINAGPYANEKYRMAVDILVDSKAAAKRLRKNIRCNSMGVGKDIYQIGNPYYKRNCLVDGVYIQEEEEEMARPYLTVREYALKYDIPKTTIYTWIRQGKLESIETARPKLVLDEGKAPEKDPSIHKWRYLFSQK